MGEAAAACPKCGTARTAGRTHCPTCGLAHDRMAAFAKARDDVPAVLGAAWDKLLEKWDDATRHDALLHLVTQHDAYAWAAARYRDRIRAGGEAAQLVIAEAQLDRVRRAAEATMMAKAAARPSASPAPYRNTVAMLAFFVILIVAGVVYVIARGGSTDGVRRERFDHVAPPSAPVERK